MVNNTEGTKEALQSSSTSSETKVGSNQNLVKIAVDNTEKDINAKKATDVNTSHHILEKEIKNITSNAKDTPTSLSALKTTQASSTLAKDENKETLKFKEKEPLASKEVSSGIKGAEKPSCATGQSKRDNNMQLTVSGSTGSSHTTGGPGGRFSYTRW